MFGALHRFISTAGDVEYAIQTAQRLWPLVVEAWASSWTAPAISVAGLVVLFFAPRNTQRKRRHETLLHDNVLWMDEGDDKSGTFTVGPFCPRDETRLRWLPHPTTLDIESQEFRYDILIGTNDGRLICPDCETKYLITPGDGSRKELAVSRGEASAKFEAVRRRRR
ncbi:MAG: hypothetical protein EPO26_16530 [Chloroflexota bacterium]|nr:MAG: hypothetical protein EPO26_16530 [Chloroflexota bacterium]